MQTVCGVNAYSYYLEHVSFKKTHYTDSRTLRSSLKSRKALR